MPQLYCLSCWNGSRQPTPATWDIDDDLFCDAHKQLLGYAASEGKRIGRADAIAPATPSVPAAVAAGRAPVSMAVAAVSAAPVQDKRLKAHATVVPIPERLAAAIVPRKTIALSPTKEANMGKRICSEPGCAKRLNSANRSGRCSAHYYVPKTPRSPEVNRTCSVGGCTKKLRSDNRSGICMQHQERTGKPNGRPLTKPNAPPAKLIPNIPAQGNGHGTMATIRVPASALESWWTKLALDDRAEVFSNWISRADS